MNRRIIAYFVCSITVLGGTRSCWAAAAQVQIEKKPDGVKEASDFIIDPKSLLDGEISFSKGLLIEGKVEKPQVQFTLIKEAPPKKEIFFETSFLTEILELERENTFNP